MNKVLINEVDHMTKLLKKHARIFLIIFAIFIVMMVLHLSISMYSASYSSVLLDGIHIPNQVTSISSSDKELGQFFAPNFLKHVYRLMVLTMLVSCGIMFITKREFNFITFAPPIVMFLIMPFINSLSDNEPVNNFVDIDKLVNENNIVAVQRILNQNYKLELAYILTQVSIDLKQKKIKIEGKDNNEILDFYYLEAPSFLANLNKDNISKLDPYVLAKLHRATGQSDNPPYISEFVKKQNKINFVSSIVKYSLFVTSFVFILYASILLLTYRNLRISKKLTLRSL